MTAKRFTLIEYLPNVIRIEDMGRKLDGKEIVDLLNDLSEENQDLKAFNQDLSEELSVCANARISKDNRIENLEKKIQRERNSFRKTQERWSKEAETKIKELSEENEQLKSKYSEQCTQLDFLKDENQHMRDLVNKNKQLKDDVYDWKASAEDYLKLGKSLKKENEQLKKENKKLKCINKQVEDRLENSGIGIALDMGECE